MGFFSLYWLAKKIREEELSLVNSRQLSCNPCPRLTNSRFSIPMKLMFSFDQDMKSSHATLNNFSSIHNWCKTKEAQNLLGRLWRKVVQSSGVLGIFSCFQFLLSLKFGFPSSLLGLLRKWKHENHWNGMWICLTQERGFAMYTTATKSLQGHTNFINSWFERHAKKKYLQIYQLI